MLWQCRCQEFDFCSWFSVDAEHQDCVVVCSSIIQSFRWCKEYRFSAPASPHKILLMECWTMQGSYAHANFINNEIELVFIASLSCWDSENSTTICTFLEKLLEVRRKQRDPGCDSIFHVNQRSKWILESDDTFSEFDLKKITLQCNCCSFVLEKCSKRSEFWTVCESWLESASKNQQQKMVRNPAIQSLRHNRFE